MRRLTIYAAMAAYVLVAGSATAADLFDGPGSLKDEPFAPPPFSWTGFYLGGSFGFAAGDTTVNNFPPNIHPFGVTGLDVDIDGAVYGGHIGYNWQWPRWLPQLLPDWMIGLEVSYSGTNMDDADFSPDLYTAEVESYGTLAGRLGYAFDRTLFYGFGGWAWGDVDTSVVILGTTHSKSDTHSGWVAGLGIEYAMTDNWLVRVEYSHVDLGSESRRFSSVPDEVDFKYDVDTEFDVIRIGASYKFGGFRRPLEPFK